MSLTSFDHNFVVSHHSMIFSLKLAGKVAGDMHSFNDRPLRKRKDFLGSFFTGKCVCVSLNFCELLPCCCYVLRIKTPTFIRPGTAPGSEDICCNIPDMLGKRGLG